MKLAICILNYQSKEASDRCLKAIFEHPPGCGYHVYYIDNDSRDGSLEYIQSRWKQKEQVTFVQNGKNLGFGRGYNRVLTTLDSEYVCIMNPDIEVREKTLDTLVQYMEEHPKIGITGPQLIYEDGVVQDSYRRFATIMDLAIKRTSLKKIPFLKKRLGHHLMWEKDKNKTETVNWLVGAFLMIRTSALKQVGYFDERFFLFFEDSDLCRRMWQAGLEVVYHPAAKARHHHERLSAGGLMDIFRKKTLRIHLVSGMKYFWKWLWIREKR